MASRLVLTISDTAEKQDLVLQAGWRKIQLALPQTVSHLTAYRQDMPLAIRLCVPCRNRMKTLFHISLHRIIKKKYRKILLFAPSQGENKC